MEKLKWMAILLLILGVLLKIEHLPGAAVTLLLSGLLGMIYCGNRVIKG